MAKFDTALNKLNVNFSYYGNPPSNEQEYIEMVFKSFEGNKPSWSAIQNKVAELEQEEQAKIDAKASALAKLSALGLTEEEVQAIIK
jgi:hypothetical protein